MNASEILSAMDAGEDKDWEFKSAKGGTPRSLWETYSAMANTDGGVIVLGVKEHEGDFEVQGLDDAAKTEKDFWTTINNRGKVSVNLLASDDVRIVPVIGKSVLIVKVPRATRRQRPVFVGQNPLEGTYRRHGDGDYLCSREEVGRMLADQADYPADCEILTGFRLEDLDKRSLDQYRNRFASRSPAHPWLKSDDRGVLEKIGGWRTDRASGQEGLTVAGLLMFGKDEAIRDPAAIPQYHVDYRERLSSDPLSRTSGSNSSAPTTPPTLPDCYKTLWQKAFWKRTAMAGGHRTGCLVDWRSPAIRKQPLQTQRQGSPYLSGRAPNITTRAPNIAN